MLSLKTNLTTKVALSGVAQLQWRSGEYVHAYFIQ